MINRFYYAVMTLGITSSVLFACSGGDDDGAKRDREDNGSVQYRGNSSEATVNGANSKELGQNALDAMAYSKDADNAQGMVPVSQTGTARINLALHAESSNGECGGSVEVAHVGTDYSEKFHNYCIKNDDGEVRINGILRTTIDITAKLSTVSFVALTVTTGGKEIVLNGSQETDLNSGRVTIRWDVTHEGKSYRIVDYAVMGDDFSGYTVTDGRLFHEIYGSVTVSAQSPVTYFDCANGKPMHGKLIYSGAAGSTGSVEFLNCQQYQVCVGNSTMCDEYTWQ